MLSSSSSFFLSLQAVQVNYINSVAHNLGCESLQFIYTAMLHCTHFLALLALQFHFSPIIVFMES